MPFNGSGGFVSVGAPNFPAVDGTTILASQYNTQLNDIFNGLSNAVTRDGQSPATANLPMGGFNFSNLGDGAVAGRALVYGQATTAVLGGALTLPLGSAAAPSFSFTGDTNTGMYSPGADQIGLATGGAFGLLVDASQRVVIGAASTGNKLRVTSSDAVYSVKIENTRGDPTGYGLWVDTRWNAGSNIVARFSTNSGISDILNLYGDTSAAFSGPVSVANAATTTLTGAVVAGGSLSPANYGLRVVSTTGDRLRFASMGAGVGGFIDVTDSGETTTARPLTLGASNSTVYLGGSTQFTKDGNGNVWLGGSPSFATWRASANAFRAGIFATLHTASNSATTVGFGAIEYGTNTYSYSTTGDTATMYQQITGSHNFYTSGSAGTAGTPITWTQQARFDAGGVNAYTAQTANGLAAIFRAAPTGSNGPALNFYGWNNSSADVNTARLYMQTISGTPGSEGADLYVLTKPTGGALQNSFRWSSAGQVYADRIHNNASGAAGTTPMIASGTYTPTITQGTNCSGGTPAVNGTFKWLRVGNVVKLSGWLSSTGGFTTADTYSELLLSLPIASNFTALSDATGVLSFSNLSATQFIQGQYVIADTVGDRLVLSFYPDTTSGSYLFVEATYEVK